MPTQVRSKHQWSTGTDRLWHDNRWVLRLHARSIRLFDLRKELHALGLPTQHADYDLLLTYKKLSIGLESGRFTFKECEEILMRIEDFFEWRNVKKLLSTIDNVPDDVFKFCIKVGFIDDGAKWDRRGMTY